MAADALHVVGEELQFGLDYQLPSTLEVGTGTALFHLRLVLLPRSEIRSLSSTSTRAQQVMAYGCRGATVLRAFQSGDEPSSEGP